MRYLQKYGWYCLAGLIFIFNIYYLFQIETIGFDEVFSLHHTVLAQKYKISWLHTDIHTPLYNYLLMGWSIILGFNLTSAKLMSAFISIMTLMFVRSFAKKHFDDLAGAYATLILASSNIFILYSNQARSYSLLMLLSLASMYYFLNAIFENNKGDLKKYLITLALLPYSHIIGFFMYGIQFLFLIIHVRNKAKIIQLLSCMALGLLCYAPVALKILSDYDIPADTIKQYSYVDPPAPSVLWSWFTHYAGNYTISIFFTVVLLVFIALWLRERNLSKLSVSVCLFLWASIPSAMLYAFSYLVAPIYMPRAIASGVIPMALIVGGALNQVKKSGKIFLAFTVVIMALILFESQKTNATLFLNRTDNANLSLARDSIVAFLKRDTNKTLPIFYVKDLQYNMSYFFERECFEQVEFIDCMSARGIHMINPGDLESTIRTQKSDFSVILMWKPSAQQMYDLANENGYEIENDFASIKTQLVHMNFKKIK